MLHHVDTRYKRIKHCGLPFSKEKCKKSKGAFSSLDTFNDFWLFDPFCANFIEMKKTQSMDDGFRRGNDGNLYRYFSTPKTWKDAKQHCESQKAVLAVSKTNETRMYMRQMFPNNFWIGLSNHSVDNMWKWADGKDMVNTNWDPKMKKAAKGLGCAHMVEEGKWNQSSCEMKKPFLCQRAGKYYLVRGHI